MSGFVRCSSGHTGPAWTCVLPAGHDGEHIYSLWSEIATMAEAEIRLHDAAIQRVKDYCERRREDRGGDLTALDVLRLLHGSPVVGDLSSQADDGQRLDVNALLSARMEQVERAEKAEAALQRVRELHGRHDPNCALSNAGDSSSVVLNHLRALGKQTVEGKGVPSIGLFEWSAPKGSRPGQRAPGCPYGEDCAGAGLCLACREEYPCATIRVLEGDSDDPAGT